MLKDMFTLSGRWGRLNRIRYFGYNVLIGVILMLCFIAFFFLTLLGMSDISGLAGIGTALLLVIPLFLVVIWVKICLIVKRLHDLNQSGWWILALLALYGLSFGGWWYLSDMGDSMEIVALVFNLPITGMTLWLLFWPGTDGDNQYGPDPRLV